MGKKDKEAKLAKKAEKEAKKRARAQANNPLGQIPWAKVMSGIILFGLGSVKLMEWLGKKPVEYDTLPEFHKGRFVRSVDTEAGFNDAISSELALVKFYAPWCGHCKAMAPQYAQAAEQLSNNDRVNLISVDCTDPGNSGTCRAANITGYPTIKAYANGEEFEDEKVSNAARAAPSAIKYVNDYLKIDNIKNLEADFNDFESLDNVVVGKFASKFAPEVEKFKAWADDEKTNLATTYNFAIHVSEEQNSGSSLSIYKNGVSVADFTGSSWEAAELEVFFKNNYYAYDTTAPKIYNSEMANFGFPNFLILHNEPDQFQDVANQLLKENKDSGRKIAIGERDNFMPIIQKYNLKKELGSKKPTLIAMDNENESFICPAGTSPQKCLSKVNAGQIEMWMKSEPLPKDDSDKYEEGSKVRKVVAKEIKDVVFDQDKDVLLEIYAPWCGHCKQLAPEYERLATDIAEKTDKIVIAKVDGTLNSMPNSLAYTGFPTLYWVPAGSSEPIKPQGRDYNGLLKHVVKSATVPLDIDIPLKSQELPEPNQAGEVVQLVGNNMKKLVNGDKNYLIKFYAPWCGHCKAMAPDFVKLADDLKDQFDDVALAEIDMTANESPLDGFDYTGFPTLFWVPKGSTTPEKADGAGRSFDSMKTYIEEKLGGSGSEDEGEEEIRDEL